MRIWLSVAMLATGVSLMALAQLAVAAPTGPGGVFQFGTTGASTQIDPQVAYVTTAWWLEYATAAKLYNYPPARGRVTLRGLEGRQALLVLHQEGLPLQRWHARHGEELQVRDRPGREP
jgi:hypothetical protein